ncbi:MAG: hypothetical protein KBI47_06645 [Armatimonadetes bacterium]|jgi:hypothetical protein|nr:hypothetical protein [Armatimonadota bacterium]MDI9584540.1 hypothetical protein [Acidobacteriota bacterium]
MNDHQGEEHQGEAEDKRARMLAGLLPDYHVGSVLPEEPGEQITWQASWNRPGPRAC